jgi:hypothetical protein
MDAAKLGFKVEDASPAYRSKKMEQGFERRAGEQSLKLYEE